MDWRDEWWAATLAPDGFWYRERPGDHFRTSAGDARDPAMTGAFARALLDRVTAALHENEESVTPGHRGADCRNTVLGMVDLGAADGSLLREIARHRPTWSLHGVDVRPAPAGLPSAAAWSRAVWDVRTSRWTDPDGLPTGEPWAGAMPGPLLVVAHEWLDDLPCHVARRVPGGWELLGPDGPTGAAPAAEEAAWLDAWAGDAQIAEVGLTRDLAWAATAVGLPPGSVLVAVDYGHLRQTRPLQGSLLGYRDGRLVDPVPDGRTDITAPVAVDALAAAVERVPGVRRRLFARQCEVVGAPASAAAEGSALDRLVGANRRRVLADPTRLGANWWLIHTVDPAS